MTQYLSALDTETVPDREAMPAHALARLEDPAYFPPVCFHKVVVASLVQAEIFRTAAHGNREWYRVTGVRSQNGDERQILERFWRGYVPKIKPRIVTWNGRNFDMPVLKMRGLIHGVLEAEWHQSGHTKFTNYNNRYATDMHCDLMDAVGDFGAARNISLDDMAAAMGLPGKIGGHGSHVEQMVREGRIDEVTAYCECDALNLFCMYVRWSYVTGRTDAVGHNDSMQSLGDYLERERGNSPHFGVFLDKWNASTRPCPRMVEEPVLEPSVVDEDGYSPPPYGM